MSAYRAKLITILIAGGLIVGACVAAGLHFFLPTFDWNWFFAILLFFIGMESISISLVESYSQKVDSRKLINVFMVTKIIKFLLAAFFVLIYVFANGTSLKSFAIVFIIFALLFLFLETLLFVRIEKRMKAKNEIK